MPDRILKPWPFTPAPQLVADLGGTNTRVALADGGVLRQGSIRRFANAGHASLSDILRAYLAQTATTECSGVCVAVAGPVTDDSCAAEGVRTFGAAPFRLLSSCPSYGLRMCAWSGTSRGSSTRLP